MSIRSCSSLRLRGQSATVHATCSTATHSLRHLSRNNSTSTSRYHLIESSSSSVSSVYNARLSSSSSYHHHRSLFLSLGLPKNRHGQAQLPCYSSFKSSSSSSSSSNSNINTSSMSPSLSAMRYATISRQCGSRLTIPLISNANTMRSQKFLSISAATHPSRLTLRRKSTNSNLLPRSGRLNDAWKIVPSFLGYRLMSTSSSSSSSASSSKKSTTTTNAAAEEASGPAETQYGDPDSAEVQRLKRDESGALSTFVVIKEKTEETISVIYIVGVIFCCFPYAVYLALQSIFSKSSPEHVKDESFDMLRNDHRVARAVGHDVMCKAHYNHATFVDNDGCDRLQVIYEVTGSKGDARVDVEMLKDGKEWKYQYVIVSTNYSVIKVLDNRSPVYASAL